MSFVGYLLLSNLDQAGHPTKYKGLYRIGPDSVFPEPGSPEYSIWEQMMQVSFDNEFASFIQTCDDAQALQKQYKALGRDYELIECVGLRPGETTQQQHSTAMFLGYDIANPNCYSLLYDGAAGWSEELLVQHSEKPCYPLWELEWRYFAQRLNCSGLLDSLDDANLYLSIERYIVSIHSDLDLYDANEALVFALSRVGVPKGENPKENRENRGRSTN